MSTLCTENTKRIGNYTIPLIPLISVVLKNRNFVAVVLDGPFKTGFSGTQRYSVIPSQLSVLAVLCFVPIRHLIPTYASSTKLILSKSVKHYNLQNERSKLRQQRKGVRIWNRNESYPVTSSARSWWEFPAKMTMPR